MAHEFGNYYVTGKYEKYDIAICAMGFPESGTLKILELKNACLPVVSQLLTYTVSAKANCNF